jgi:hypothetical protein
MDHLKALAAMTGTRPSEWEDADGPDTRCGVDYYYAHVSEEMFARVNDDQGHVTFSIFNADGDELDFSTPTALRSSSRSHSRN